MENGPFSASTNTTAPILPLDEESRQRAARGFSTDDTFSFDGYLAKVIAGGVKELRERAVGCPTALLPHDGGMPLDNKESMQEGMRKWDDILKRIERGFQVYAAEDDWDRPEVKEAMTLFAEWFPCLWD